MSNRVAHGFYIVAAVGWGLFMLQAIAFLVDRFVVDLGLLLSRIVGIGMLGFVLAFFSGGIGIVLAYGGRMRRVGVVSIAIGLLLLMTFIFLLSL